MYIHLWLSITMYEDTIPTFVIGVCHVIKLLIVEQNMCRCDASLSEVNLRGQSGKKTVFLEQLIVLCDIFI
jgi:hypothetical protein